MASISTSQRLQTRTAGAPSRKLLVILDLDRTLFDTSAYYAMVLDWARSTQGDTLADAMIEAERHGNFDIFRYLSETYGWRREDIRSQLARYISRQQSQHACKNFLLPDAKELIRFLRGQTKAFIGIITAGSSFHQEFKLSLCPALDDLPFEVIEGNKGERIQADISAYDAVNFDDKWFEDFAIVDDKVSSVVAIKPIGLLSVSPSHHLFHVIREDGKDCDPSGRIDINTVPSLREVTARLRTVLASRP